MQDVSANFKADAIASNRYPAQKVLVSWLKNAIAGDFFAIGSSTIGGEDIIKGTQESASEWDTFEYDDETENVMGIELDREFTEPVYSVAKALCDITFDNNSGRYTPEVDPEIGAYILTKRPVRVNIGFKDETVQKFVGEILDHPIIDKENNTLTVHCTDFMQYIWEYPLVETTLYEDDRSDELIENLLSSCGLTSDKYELDTGMNTIKYAFFSKGDKVGPIIEKICQAEQAFFFMDENGKFHFWNRTHLLQHSTSQLTITDNMVIKETDENPDRIINIVEVTAKPRVVQSNQVIFQLAGGDSRKILPGETIEFFCNYNDPCTVITAPSAGGGTSVFVANSASDGSGADMTAQCQLVSWYDFSTASKVAFKNNDTSDIYITTLTIYGTPAIMVPEQGVDARYEDTTSSGEYGQHIYKIDNDFIQSYDDAYRIAKNIVRDRKDPGSYKKMTIPAQPHLQLGDKITRGDTDYWIIRSSTKFTQDDGLIQELTVVNRTIEVYKEQVLIEDLSTDNYKDGSNTTAYWDYNNSQINLNYLTDELIDTLNDSYASTNDIPVSSTWSGGAGGQSFTPSVDIKLTSAEFYLKKYGSPTGNAVLKIYSHSGTYGSSDVPTGSALATSDVLDVSTLTTSYAWENFIFSGANQISLTAGTHYCLVLEYTGGNSGNYVLIDCGDNLNDHAGGAFSKTGGTWLSEGGVDCIFSVIGARYDTENNVAQSLGYDLGYGYVEHSEQVINYNNNGGSILIEYSDSDDNVTFGDWTEYPSALHKRYIRWRATFTGTITSSPELLSLTLGYLV